MTNPHKNSFGPEFWQVQQVANDASFQLRHSFAALPKELHWGSSTADEDDPELAGKKNEYAASTSFLGSGPKASKGDQREQAVVEMVRWINKLFRSDLDKPRECRPAIA